MFVVCCLTMWIQNSSSLPPLPVGGLAQCGASWEKSTILPQFFSESNKVSRVYLVSYILLFYSILSCLFMRQCVARLCSMSSITVVYVYWCFLFRIWTYSRFLLVTLFHIRDGTFSLCVNYAHLLKWHHRCIGLPAVLLHHRIRLVSYWLVTVSPPVSTDIVAHMVLSMADLTQFAFLCLLCPAGGPSWLSQRRCPADFRGPRH
jgi:hypothetical protein